MLSESRVPTDWSLRILNVTMDDADTYDCSAGLNRTEIGLSVGVAPYFEESDGNASKTVEVELAEGKLETLSCLPKGIPQPNVSWYQIPPENPANKNLVSRQPRYTVEAKENGSELKFFCLAENTLGNATIWFLIKIVGRSTKFPDANDETNKLPSIATTQHVLTTNRGSSATNQEEPLGMLTKTLFVVVIYSILVTILV